MAAAQAAAAGEQRRRSDTRERIQAIAVELFVEQGYDKTSLQEIADRLGVTKAALYYHFKSKEAIVASLFHDWLAAVDQIIDWAREQPRTPQTRQELLRRYNQVLDNTGSGMTRFVQESQQAMRHLSIGPQLLQRFRALAALLTDPDAPPRAQLKSSLALVTLHIGRFAPYQLPEQISDADRRAAALDVALELVASQ